MLVRGGVDELKKNDAMLARYTPKWHGYLKAKGVLIVNLLLRILTVMKHFLTTRDECFQICTLQGGPDQHGEVGTYLHKGWPDDVGPT